MKIGSNEPHTAEVYEFGEFRLDSERRVLLRNGDHVPLTPRVFDTLLYLVAHNGELLEKERLMDALWPDTVVEENNLTQNISTLRRVFGEAPGSHRYIVTVPGRGYRFVAQVRIALEQVIPEAVEAQATVGPVEPETDDHLHAPVQIQPAGEPVRRSSVGWWALAATVALLAIAFFSWRGQDKPAQNPTSSIASVLPALPEKSIAVLPFSNLSDEKENAFFCEGVQDDILTALAKITDLKVISRTSVANYVIGPTRNLRQIGQELGVSNILEGSVRRAGGKVRVTAQLIETRTNTHIWAETYDRELKDVFAIQSEIAEQIARALQAKFAPEEKARVEIPPTANAEAYALYLTASGRAGRPNGSTADEMAAEELYLKAIALDPGFALAYARASMLNSDMGTANDDRERKAKARVQAETALQLAPDLGEAHMALGLCLFWAEKNYAAALKEFDRAAGSLPNNAEIPGYRAGIYRRQGRWREAVAELDRAKTLDPRNRQVAMLSGNNHLFTRNWDEAAVEFRRAAELAPDAALPRVALAYIQLYKQSDPATAKKMLDGLLPDSQGFVRSAQWDFAVLARDYAAADELLAKEPGDFFPGRSAEETPKSVLRGQVAYANGDLESARALFESARPLLEQRVGDHSEIARHHAALALLYAGLQRKEDAVRESLRAVELEPESVNAFHGVSYSANLAVVYARTGEPDKALDLIERLLTTPGAATYPGYASSLTLAELRLRWEWDPLRSHPRFQKLLAGPEPKTVY